MVNIPKIQKAFFPHIPQIDPSIPLDILKKISRIPLSIWPIFLYPLKAFQGFNIVSVVIKRKHLTNCVFYLGQRKEYVCFRLHEFFR